MDRIVHKEAESADDTCELVKLCISLKGTRLLLGEGNVHVAGGPSGQSCCCWHTSRTI